MVLSAQQVEQFKRDGHVSPLDILDGAEVRDLRQRLEAREALQGGNLEPGQRAKSHLIFKWLDDLIRDPRILDPIEQLIGPDILCWNTIFWIKDVGSESFVGWHQDTRYWGLSSPDVITAWLALSPASMESGCMRVLPGTHVGEVMPHEDLYDEANMLTRGQEISEGVDEDVAVHMPLEPGQMSFHNYRLAHASGANRAPDRRIGISMHFMPPDTRQIVGDWDSAALVRGTDSHGNFAPTPVPAEDFDPEAMAFHARAAKAQSEVLYKGAAVNTQKL
ncbi:MAG: phytanoyl-CoA dioxygenase [Rhodospirillaceae bacterium]|jgi:non-haem Fe2+, alpha-ketoglutarate-dependent halogenase|nr:phytanoyl-CoA dioxygenase [Rhodospirillaceae bacterium]MBT5895901.1 phytanoyl-CoA dioxygenase [Rhodospirillaceae bacterium]MBT6430976.1 phytanoyl-CoA dioxygenase [Rhodospirillaceae bacterium]MBT7755963.1 phytanoyl-CoA dioxygenase [Rhodospirillaceae bacterium]